MFSHSVVDLLQRAGWREDREVDVAPYVAHLEQVGHPVYAPVREFLKRFAGLHIPFPRQKGADGDLDFRLLDMCLDPINVKQCSDDAGIVFCPIGLEDDGWNYVLMAPDGKVYIRYPDGLSRVGANAEQAIENVLMDKDFPNLGYGPVDAEGI